MGALGVNRFWITTLGSPARGLSVLRWLMKAMWDPRTLVSARQEVFDGVLRMAGVVRSVISTRFLVQCGWPIGVRWCNRSLCWGCWARRGALTLVHLVYKRIWWNLAKLVFVIPIFEIYLLMSFNHIGEQKSLLAGRSFFFFCWVWCLELQIPFSTNSWRICLLITGSGEPFHWCLPSVSGSSQDMNAIHVLEGHIISLYWQRAMLRGWLWGCFV